MMKIIVGLGNPGEKYKNTRHNAGFLFVEKMAGKEIFRFDKKFEAEILELDGLMLVKPQTFMNESGRSVRKILDFYKLTVDDLVVAHDDLDLELGERKLQAGVGPKVHNGVNSIEQYLGKDFLRVRLGIDNRKNVPTDLSGADYVLDNFGKEEKDRLDEVIEAAIAELLITLSL